MTARVLNERTDPRDRVPESAEIAAAGSRFGDLVRTLAVGRLRIRLEGLDAELAALVEGNYRGFVDPRDEAPTSVVEVVRSIEDAWLHLSRDPGVVEDARVNARSTEEWLELWSYGFAGRFDREARGGRLMLCDGEPHVRSREIENYLRFGIAASALAHGGFLLHAAGVARHGRAWVFFGPSGAGKSTTASLAPADADLLGDDLVLLEPPGSGSPDSWRACGVPFRGTFSRGENSAAAAPLAMALRLVQAAENKLVEVPRIVQAGEVLAQLPFLMDDARMRARAAERVEVFVREVPVRRLHLRRDGSYWSLLE